MSQTETKKDLVLDLENLNVRLEKGEKEKKLRNISFRKIHEALNADISSIKAYNTLSPLYNSFERLMKITSAKEIDYKFQKEEKKWAQKIFDLIAFFASDNK